MKHDDKYTAFLDNETLRDDLKKKSLRGGLYIMLGSGLNLLLSLGATAVLARILIPEHFGLISMVTALTVIAERFKDLGLNTATVQKKGVTHEQVSTLFWINVLIGVLITVVLCAISRLIAWFYADERLIWITMALATSFFWSGMTIQHQAILNRKMQFARITAVNTGASFFSVGVAIVLAVKGYGYWALVWREILRSFFTAAGTWIACPWVPGLPNRDAKIGGMLRFGGHITAFNLITFFTHNLDQILIGKYSGAGPLGFFRQASQLALLPIDYLTSPVHAVAQPALSVLQHDAERYRRYYKKILKSLSFVNMPVMVFLFLYAKEIILLVLGEKWIEAVVIFKIFALAGLIRPVVSTTGFVMITHGYTRRYLFLGLANSAAIILAMAIGLKWGAVGVAAGHVLENYLVFLPVVYLAFRDTPVSVGLFLSSILPAVICSLLMGAALVAFSFVNPAQSSFSVIAVSLPVGFIVYLAAWMLMPEGSLRLREFFSDIFMMFKKPEIG